MSTTGAVSQALMRYLGFVALLFSPCEFLCMKALGEGSQFIGEGGMVQSFDLLDFDLLHTRYGTVQMQVFSIPRKNYYRASCALDSQEFVVTHPAGLMSIYPKIQVKWHGVLDGIDPEVTLFEVRIKVSGKETRYFFTTANAAPILLRANEDGSGYYMLSHDQHQFSFDDLPKSAFHTPAQKVKANDLIMVRFCNVVEQVELEITGFYALSYPIARDWN